MCAEFVIIKLNARSRFVGCDSQAIFNDQGPFGIFINGKTMDFQPTSTHLAGKQTNVKLLYPMTTDHQA